jgi:hypothetical protein
VRGAQGQVRPDRERFEIDDIVFTSTCLDLDGLVSRPVHHVEVLNRTLPVDDTDRVRHFGYNSADFRMWLEKPTASLLRPPHGWPVLAPAKAPTWKEAWVIDKEEAKGAWFTRPLSAGEKGLWGVPVMWGAFALFKGAMTWQDKTAVARISELLDRHVVRGQYHIPEERRRLDVDGLGFWLTPLRSAVSEQTVLYHAVVLNRELSLHPKRAVAFHYNLASRPLEWL